MVEPGAAAGQPPGAERNGMSFSNRMLLLAILYLFIKRYVGDGAAGKSPATSDKAPAGAASGAREVPVAPLAESVPTKHNHARPAIDDPEDEFAGMGGSTKNTGEGSLGSSSGDDARSAAQQLAVADSSVEFGGAASLGADTGAGAVGGGGDVPQVLVQFCVS
ncbi:unnamed protein product [Ectocarpus sp. 12 AP-2014]